MKDLIKLKIVFENCDTVTIDGNHIYNFNISNITERISFVANLLTNGVLMYKHAGYCQLTLKWNDVKHLIVSLSETELEKRIEGNDITHYHLYLSDGSVLEIHTPWGDHEYTNTKEEHIVGEELFIITHKD